MNQLVSLLNPQQWKVIGAMLLGATGPFAWLMSRKLGMSDADIKMWLDVIATLTPLIAGGFVAKTQTNAAQVQAVATMPVDEKAKALATVSDAGRASIAAALPDKAVVIAAGSMPGVQVHVDESTAPLPVVTVANDPRVRDVVPMVGGPRIDPGKIG